MVLVFIVPLTKKLYISIMVRLLHIVKTVTDFWSMMKFIIWIMTNAQKFAKTVTKIVNGVEYVDVSSMKKMLVAMTDTVQTVIN